MAGSMDNALGVFSMNRSIRGHGRQSVLRCYTDARDDVYQIGVGTWNLCPAAVDSAPALLGLTLDRCLPSNNASANQHWTVGLCRVVLCSRL